MLLQFPGMARNDTGDTDAALAQDQKQFWSTRKSNMPPWFWYQIALAALFCWHQVPRNDQSEILAPEALKICPPPELEVNEQFSATTVLALPDTVNMSLAALTMPPLVLPMDPRIFTAPLITIGEVVL